MIQPSFNLIKDLNILFVDIDNRQGRRQYNGVKHFFQSDTILWDFLHEYLPLKNCPAKIDALNVNDVLRANNMGYTHIEVGGRRWEEIHPEEQAKLIQNFNANVRKLKPQLLFILGRKTYSNLFKNQVPSIRGKMPTGFSPLKVEWTKRNGIQEGSRVFLMRKTKFKTSEERNRVGKKLKRGLKLLNEFKKKHGSVFTPVRGIESTRAVNKNRKRAFDEMTDSFANLCVDPIATRRIKKMKMKRT